jgi:hypothetical protein
MGVLGFASGSATTNGPFGDMSTILTAYAGVIILVVLLPFVATFILDGVVLVFRGRGLKPLMLGVAFTILVTILGLVAVSYGQAEAGPTPGTAAGMESMTRMLLPFSIGLALLAFVSRTVSTVLKGSGSARRRRRV